MSYVLIKSFVACVPVRSFFFFTAAHFHFADHYHFSFSHHQFSCFSSNKIVLLCFLSNALALSLSSTSVKTLKLSRTWYCCCFFSLTFGWPCDFPPKTPVLHLGYHTCWLSYFTLVACGADGRAYGHAINKNSWVHTKFSYPWCSAESASLSTYIT